jgi:hypothetical protein
LQLLKEAVMPQSTLSVLDRSAPQSTCDASREQDLRPRPMPDVPRAARTYLFAPANPRDRAATGDFPDQATLVFPDARSSAPSQLIIGHTPLPAGVWHWDASSGTVSWHYRAADGQHGGRLSLSSDRRKCVGTLLLGTKTLSIVGDLPPITYTCSVALNTGAQASGTASMKLSWDTGSASWQQATWVANALALTYQVVGDYIVGQRFYGIAVNYVDEQTADTWYPDKHDVSCMIDENSVFTLTAQGVDPDPDDRSTLKDPNAAAIQSVFPYLLSVQMSATGQQIAGAMLTLEDSQKGTVLGVQGVANNPSVVGLYSVHSGRGQASFSVYGGKLWIGDQPVASSRLVGNRLTWTDLPPALRTTGGLGEAGELEFTDDGASFASPTATTVVGRRLTGDEVAYGRAMPGTLRTAPALSLTDLDNKSQFRLVTDPATGKPVWADVVQQAMMNDFNQIVLYYMPDDLRRTFYGEAQVNLSPPLQQIAAMAPTGSDPGTWYQSLAVAFLTNVLSTSQEDGADQLNALRAQAWLKSQTATSPVFQMQSSALYALEWRKLGRNANIDAYLKDQVEKQAQYDALIEADRQKWLRDLEQTIVDANARTQMADVVNNLAATASDGALYWAYAYFRYSTLPSQMAILQMMALGQTSDKDGSAWLRETQRRFVILSLLDPSSLFANQYVSAVNTMFFANTVPSFVDVGSSSIDYRHGVAAVLRQTVVQCAGSQDAVVREIGADAADLLARSDLGSLVSRMQAAAAGTASAAWTATAQPMANAATPTVGSRAATVLCLAMASVATTSALYGTTDWTRATVAATSQAAPVPADTSRAVTAAQYLIQIATFALKWGVALNAVFDSYATAWDAMTSLFSTALLERANQAIQGGFSKWLIDNGERPIDSEIFGDMFVEDAAGSERVLYAVFGRNLDEFVAIRLGAIFAGINLIISAINLANASDDLDEAANALGVAAASLNLFATGGAWALGAAGITELGGLEVATICSVLGALGVLAAIAGIVILLVMYFKKHPTAVQEFATNQAQAAGFYMPYSSAIDYFDGYTDETSLLRLGVSLFAASGALAANGDGSVHMASEDHSYATVFFCTTDGLGRTQLGAIVGADGAATSMVLTGNTDDTVSFQAAGQSGSDLAARQQWSAALLGGPSMDGAHPQSGSFTLQLNGTSKYLRWSNGAVALGDPDLAAIWRITQEAMAPAGLSMANIALYTTSQGQVFTPVLSQPGSTPQTWSVSPALPAFLTLDTGTGKVSQVPGQARPVTPAATYTLSVSNAVSAQPATTTFTVAVAQHA